MSETTTVAAYLAALPADRRAALSAVRDVIRANLPAGFEETIQYGMIGYVVPLSVKPVTYNQQPLMLAALASQKSHMALYLMGVYGDPSIEAWFRQAFAAAGKKLDMGKSCVRWKTLDALPLPVIGEVITKVSVAQLVARHDEAHPALAAKAATPATPARTTVPAAATKATATKATATATANATAKTPAKAKTPANATAKTPAKAKAPAKATAKTPAKAKAPAPVPAKAPANAKGRAKTKTAANAKKRTAAATRR